MLRCLLLLGTLLPAAARRPISWQSPIVDLNLRRLASGEQVQYTVQLNVLKTDNFGAEPPRLDISFTDNKGSLNQVYIPGTDGNAGRYLPQGLYHGQWVNMTGYVETAPPSAASMKTGMVDKGLLAGMAAGATLESTASRDKRPVFVLDHLEDVSSEPPDRRLTASATASSLSVIVVLYTPCGQTLSTTASQVETAIFPDALGSFNEALGTCSRGKMSIAGPVIELSGCPDSTDAWGTYLHIDSQLASDARWGDAVYRMIILPSTWLAAIGLATVGGGMSMYRDGYVQEPLVYLHELGHNWLLHHAAGQFANQEYADTSSSMGYCCTMRCYNFIHSYQLSLADFGDQEVWLTEPPWATRITLAALGAENPSPGHHYGVKVHTSTRSDTSDSQGDLPSYLVLSFRGAVGFDSYLRGTQYENRVQVSHWDGDHKGDAQMSHLLHNIKLGETVLVFDTTPSLTDAYARTDLKITVKEASDDFAGKEPQYVEVLLCERLADETDVALYPCGATTTTTTTESAGNEGDTGTTMTVTLAATTATTTTTTTTLAPEFSSWTQYFTSAKTSPTSNQPISGLGVMDYHPQSSWSKSFRLRYRTDILTSDSSTTWLDLTADIGELICQSGQVATEMSCVADDCTKFRLKCNSPTSGTMLQTPTQGQWFPENPTDTADSSCSGNSAVIGIRCAGAYCSSKSLICDTYLPAAGCVNHCDALKWQCGDDGCGGSCGSCGSCDGCGDSSGSCMLSVGRCMQTYATQWSESGLNMKKPDMVAKGMACQSTRCEKVQLIVIGIMSDASSVEISPWLSDNVGHRYSWNSGESADALIADCEAGKAVSYLECSGKHCDNIRFECSTPLQWRVSSAEPQITDWFSEEEGRMDCPEGMVITGLECQEVKVWCLWDCGDHCDNKRLRCSPIYPMATGSALLGVVDAAGEVSAAVTPVSHSVAASGANASGASDDFSWVISSASSTTMALSLLAVLGLQSLMQGKD